MLDKIVIMRSTNSAKIVFTDRPAVTVSCDTDIAEFVLWFLSEPGENVVSMPDRHFNSDVETTMIMPKVA